MQEGDVEPNRGRKKSRPTVGLSGWDSASGTRAGTACTAHVEGAVCKYNVYPGMHTVWRK